MDAAAAAAMSDPDCNPHFRRRWSEAPAEVHVGHAVGGAIGTFGLILREAMERRRRAETSGSCATDHTEPPR